MPTVSEIVSKRIGNAITNVNTWGGILYNVKSYDATGDGTTDDTTFIQAAIDDAVSAGGGIVYFPVGTYLITSTLEDSGIPITFMGAISNETFVNPGENASIIQTSGAITGIKLDGNRSGISDLVVLGDDGAYDADSHGIHVSASRALIRNVLLWKNRGNGLHFTLGNCSFFEHVTALQNKGHGVYVGDDGEATMDDNASAFVNIDTRANSKSGLCLGTSGSFANNFYNLSSQSNTEYGVYIDCDYNHFYGLYVESNTIKDIYFDSNADFNWVFGVFSNSDAPYYTDNTVNKRNYIQQIKQKIENVETLQLDIGSKSGGLGGFLRVSDDGTNYSISLEGTNSSMTIPITSAGTGTVTIDPDAIATESVIAPTLLNSWVNYGGSRTDAGYWKDKFGYVHLQGTIKDGTTTNPTALFTLPSGYRPSGRRRYAVNADASFGSVLIDMDGNVYIESGTNIQFSLDGIYFKT